MLEKLAAYSDAYEAIYSNVVVPEVDLKTAYERILRLEIATAVPLLAWLRTLPEIALNSSEHLRAVRAVESWALRRAFLGLQTRGYGTHLTRVLSDAKAAFDGGADIADAIIDSLQRGALACLAQ